MDLSLTEEHVALRDLARQIFDGHCTPERLRQAENDPDRFDRALWDELERAHVLGAGIPEDQGGIAGGVLAVCLVLEEAGRATAPVPLWASMLGALAMARFAEPATGRTVVALMEPGAADPYQIEATAQRVDDGWTVDGTKTMVPGARDAGAIVLAARTPDGPGLFVLDPADAVAIERQHPTGTGATYAVRMDATSVRALVEPPSDDALRWLIERALVTTCAEQVGVAERALRMTASYTSERQQFGKPLGSFQAVQQRAADAYIDVEAMRWTMLEAAWRLDAELDAAAHVEVAKVWAADAAARVLAAAQHLHGGIGVDLDYPLHRYTFAARQLELRLGGAGAHLERLGEMIAR